MSRRFDVVVAGAGPGGIAAAITAAEAGKRVCVIDGSPAPGGQIWRGISAETAHKYPHGSVFSAWMARLSWLDRSILEIHRASQAVDLVAPNRLRVESEGETPEIETRDIEFESLILATGARERFLPFPGWTLPGVMGAGGAQALVKSGLDARGKRVVVAGTGPLLLAIAAGLARAGAIVEAIVEQAPLVRLAGLGLHMALTQPGKITEGAAYRLATLHTAYRLGHWVKRAEGHTRLERVTITNGAITNGTKDRVIECDWLACGFHLVPNLELPRLLGCKVESGYVAVDALQQSSVPGVACIGELTGIGGMEKALIEGQIAGLAAGGRITEAHALMPQLRRHKEFAQRLDNAFALRDELRNLPGPQTIVCRCEDVPHALLADCNSWRQAKLHTRCGMGACQGRICGAATEFLYGWSPADSRPPVYPVRVSTLSAASDAVCTARQ